MTLKQQLADLQKSNDKLRYDNLIMRVNLTILAEDINSEASKKILAKYRRQILIRKEQELEGQN